MLDCLRFERRRGGVYFDRDDAKSERCRRDPNRAVGFDYAARILALPVLERIDRRRDDGEERIQAIGEIDGLLYFVCYTDRMQGGVLVRWIISARRAHEKERRRWLRGRSKS